MSYAAIYLKKQEHSLEKWDRFLNEDLRNSFVPLSFSEDFPSPVEDLGLKSWTPADKRQFYYLFAQFNCEALVIFEQCFMYSSRVLRKQLSNSDEKQALMHFAREEFFHTRAFRRYLAAEAIYNFPQKSLLIHRSHRLKNVFAWILRHEPMAIIIPGAKSETYSLFFTKLLEKFFGKQGNSLTHLNSLHSEDEVFHIQFDYNFADSTVEKRGFLGKLKFVFFTFLMILVIQFIVILGFFQALKMLRPQDSTWTRLCTMKAVFKWVLWSFQPYIQTRRNLQATYRQRKPLMYKLFRLGSL